MIAKSRIEAFSDGVFAIAITLLVIDIHVPDVHGHGLAHALGAQWPSYAAYATSFLTIGIIWVNHHGLFDRLARVDRTLLFVNLFLLGVVAFLPFPTAVMAKYLRGGENQHVAAALYSGTLWLMGVAFSATWLYASRGRRLLRHPLTDEQLRALRFRNVAGQFVYAAGVGLAFASATVTLVLCALVAAYYVHPGRVRGDPATERP